MKIKKTINGEVYQFYFQLIPNERKTKVRYFQSDEWIICDLSEDFDHIIIPKDQLVFNGKSVTKLKLNKSQKYDALDYNSLSKS